MKPTPIELETLYAHCSAIEFRAGTDDKNLSSIILGFDDHVTGSRAYTALHAWAKDDELVATLSRRDDYINATLIHTSQHEIVTLSGLSFNESQLHEFIKEVPQDRRLLLAHHLNPLTGYRFITQQDAASKLRLVRYIVMQPA
jgi:hypothetical protein